MKIKLTYNDSDEFNLRFHKDYLRFSDNNVIKSIRKCKSCNKVSVVIGQKSITGNCH
jgi:hypothetical protein